MFPKVRVSSITAHLISIIRMAMVEKSSFEDLPRPKQSVNGKNSRGPTEGIPDKEISQACN